MRVCNNHSKNFLFFFKVINVVTCGPKGKPCLISAKQIEFLLQSPADHPCQNESAPLGYFWYMKQLSACFLLEPQTRNSSQQPNDWSSHIHNKNLKDRASKSIPTEGKTFQTVVLSQLCYLRWENTFVI